VDKDNLGRVKDIFRGEQLSVIGRTSRSHSRLVVSQAGREVIAADLKELKKIWKNGLASYY
jgi:hypothetical protein